MRYFVDPETGEVFAFDDTPGDAPFIEALLARGVVECGRAPAPFEVWNSSTAKWEKDEAKFEAFTHAAKQAAWANIKAERDRRKAGGVKVGAKWFHSDDGSRIQQMGLVMMGANLPAGLQWKTMDGSFIVMTPALAQQIFTGQAASDQAIFAVAEQHRVAMEASPDPAAYDFSTNWPKIFGE